MRAGPDTGRMPSLMTALAISIRLFDNTNLPAADLAAAARSASHIMARAGVATVWTYCSAAAMPAECGEALAPGEVIVRIMRTPRAEAPGVLGTAIVDRTRRVGTFATVYGDRAYALADRSGVAPSDVLGRAMAHELGHLLLGTAQHSRRGLMRPVWTDIELKRDLPPDWALSQQEARRLRANLALRFTSTRGTTT